MITTTAAWRNAAQISRKGVVLVRLYYGDETSYLTIASGEIAPKKLESKYYRPMLLESPVDTAGVEMFTHKFQVSEMTLRISNGDYHTGVKFSDLINDSTLGAGDDIGIENRKIDIRLWTKGITAWSSCIQLKSGVVREISHTETEMVLSIQDKREIIHKSIDHTIIEAEAADTDQGLPEDSRGKTIPVIYGIHTFLKGDDSKASDTASSINNMVPAIYSGIDSSGRHRWRIASHIIETISVSSNQAQLWAEDKVLNRLVRVANDGGSDIVVEQNSASGCIISLLATTQYWDYFYGKGTPTTDSAGANITEFANVSRIIDKIFTTASTGSIDTGSFNLDQCEIDVIPFTVWENQNLADAAILEIILNWYGEATFAGGADGTYYVIQFLAGGTPATGTEPDTGGIYPDARMEDAFAEAPTIAEIGNNVDFLLIASKNFIADDQVVLDIYEMYKSVRYEAGQFLYVLFAGTGREYNESTGWITSRTGTETHADNNGGGNLIENLAGQIESIYRDELGRVTADIDEDSFNVASNDNTDVFAFSITEKTDSLELIRKLAQDGRSFVWLQPDGTVKMKVLEDTYTASDRVIDWNEIVNPHYSRSEPSNFYTAVDVQYLEGQALIGISEDTTMQTKYNLTEAESTLIYEALNISNATTATNLQAYLLAQWKQLHNLVEFNAGVEHIDLDIGDIIEFTNAKKAFGEDITSNTTRAGQTIYKYWWIYNVVRWDSGVKIKAFQLHKLD